MQKRFLSIWFRHLITDRMSIRHPQLRDIPFVLAEPEHGRMIITASNRLAEEQGIVKGMVVADARAVIPGLQIIDHVAGLSEKLLKAIGEWCIRYTPVVAVDLPDGLILDISGCAHLWGGEKPYLKSIVERLKSRGYHVRASIADTIGAAWANARFGSITPIIPNDEQRSAMLTFPPAALRIDPAIQDRLLKLGLKNIGSFIHMPRTALRRRFGSVLLQRIDQAFGNEIEFIQPIVPQEPYYERLPCLEPIISAGGIEVALKKLLELLCERLRKEGKGIRAAVFKNYRTDGKMIAVSIGTSKGTHHIAHLYKLFELKIPTIEPAFGIELFVLEASKVEDISPEQEALWMNDAGTLDDANLAELLDRIAGKFGAGVIQRYLPAEHHWPERSVLSASSLDEKSKVNWRADRRRPVRLLSRPQRIEVSAPIPDYPPMLFRYEGKVHHIKKADGPERIEREWWSDDGEHRDYYCVEDEQGQRYWLFRAGHYSPDRSSWFLHGFFA